MRLPRPYIPLRNRVQAAERQYAERFGFVPDRASWEKSDGVWLKALLTVLFGDQRVELHHRPALLNRTIYASEDSVEVKYIPDANDPDFLVYLPKAEHDIETRVRGQGAQLSDLAIARKRKRTEKKRARQRHLLAADDKQRVQLLDGVSASRRGVRLKRKFKWRDIGGGYKAGPVTMEQALLRDVMWPKRRWPKRKFPKRRKP